FRHATKLPHSASAGQNVYCYVCVTGAHAPHVLATLIERRYSSNRNATGQNHANGGSLSEFALGFDAAAVELRDVFDDREAESGAPDAFGAACFIGAIKTFENARQIVFINADAVVAHAERNFAPALLSSKTNSAVLAGIFHRIVEQIVEDFMQSRFFRANHRQIGCKIDNNCN